MGSLVLESSVLVWLKDAAESDHMFEDDLMQLRAVVNYFKAFTERNVCVDFMTDVEDQKVFLVVSQTIAQHLITQVHAIPQLTLIYIISSRLAPTEEWMNSWSKIRGPYENIRLLQQDLISAIKQANHDCVSLSLIPLGDVTNINRDRLEPSFMYTNIFKRTLLKIDFDYQSRKRFTNFCRENVAKSSKTIQLIDEFERNYSPDRAIWWYTRESFIYSMLNQSLRLLQGKVIFMMGFFLVDLHRQIEQLHGQQVNQYLGQPFKVYRGQRLASSDFKKLENAIGGPHFIQQLSVYQQRQRPSSRACSKRRCR